MNCQENDQFIELHISGVNSGVLSINRSNIFDDEAPLRIEIVGSDTSNVTVLTSLGFGAQGKFFFF